MENNSAQPLQPQPPQSQPLQSQPSQFQPDQPQPQSANQPIISQEKSKPKKIKKYDVLAVISLITAIIPAIILIGLLAETGTSKGPYNGIGMLAIAYFMTGIGYVMFPVSIILGIIALNKQNQHLWSRIFGIISIVINVIIIIGMIVSSIH